MNKNFLIKLLICFFAVIFIGNGAYCKEKSSNKIQEIQNRGFIIVGTTGDYKPMSYFNREKGYYEGFDIALAEDLAKSLGVNIKYVSTSWPTLMQDTISEKFDIALSGITVTNSRKRHALMSKGYLNNGKTVLCRIEDKDKYTSIEKINKSNVRVMENPGGLNEKFARENLPNANLIIHNVNYEIPGLIAKGDADVMITEVIEAVYYTNIYNNLTIPNVQFTRGKIGMLMPPKSKMLLKYVNKFIDTEYRNGRLDEIGKIYINNNL